MKTLLLAGTAAALLSFAGTSAQAALHISGGTPGTIPGAAITNDALIPLGFTTPLGGYYGGQILADAGILTITFMGYEAGANNVFQYTGDGGGSFSTAAYRVAHGGTTNAFDAGGLADATPLIRTQAIAGLVSFSFVSDANGILSVANGSNPLEGQGQSVINFFAHMGMAPGGTDAGNGGTTGDVVYLFLDDTGGRQHNPLGGWLPDDDNHDDMVIRIAWAPLPVPEPASLALFGAGLLGLGATARRRRRA